MSLLRPPFCVWTLLVMRFSLGLVLFVGCGMPTETTASRDGTLTSQPDKLLQQLGASSDRNQSGKVIRIRLEYLQDNDNALRKLLAFPQLESRKITSCHRISGIGLVAFIDLTSLITLSLNFCPRVRDDSLQSLQSLEQLANLSLDGCTGITDAGLPQLETLPQLTTLSLRDTWITFDKLSLIHI